MKKGLTELVFVLDRSGSMGHMVDDAIGGFNSMIDRQKTAEGEAVVSTVLFDDESMVVHDRVPVEQVQPLTRDTYYARGCTALLDALGGAIHHIGNVHKYARSEDVPEHTVFVITTDGMENASHRYTAERVRQMIQRQKARYGWEFLFLAANIDAVETARHYGIAPERAVQYHNDSLGTQASYQSMSDAVFAVRNCGCVPDDWRDEADRDYNARK